jgi:hypothetical protein
MPTPSTCSDACSGAQPSIPCVRLAPRMPQAGQTLLDPPLRTPAAKQTALMMSSRMHPNSSGQETLPRTTPSPSNRPLAPSSLVARHNEKAAVKVRSHHQDGLPGWARAIHTRTERGRSTPRSAVASPIWNSACTHTGTRILGRQMEGCPTCDSSREKAEISLNAE